MNRHVDSNVGRVSVIATHVVTAGLLCLGSIILVASGSRSLPTNGPLDDSAQAVAVVDRAFDLGIAAFAVAYAAVVLLALRAWTRSGRWTLPFICDVGVVVPALLLLSPAGPVVGGLTSVYLVLLACSAAIAGLVIIRDRPWNMWSGTLTVPEAARRTGKNPVIEEIDLTAVTEDSDTLPVPVGWQTMMDGRPMPDVVAAVRRSRAGH